MIAGVYPLISIHSSLESWPETPVVRAIKASGAGQCWESRTRRAWEADRLYLDYVGKDTFYGLLASLRGQLFSERFRRDLLSGQWTGQRVLLQTSTR